MSKKVDLITIEDIEKVICEVESKKETVLFNNPDMKKSHFHNSMPQKIGQYLLSDISDEDIAQIGKIASQTIGKNGLYLAFRTANEVIVEN